MVNNYLNTLIRLRNSFNNKIIIMASLSGARGTGSGAGLEMNKTMFTGTKFSAMNRIAVSNMSSTNDIDYNLQQVADIVFSAKKWGCQMVFLPESSDFIAMSKRETMELAQPINGLIVRSYCKMATKNCIWISVGGVHEATIDINNVKLLYKTHLIINDKGNVIASYRKIHLCNHILFGQDFCEKELFTPGNTVVEPVPSIIGPLGIQICYDIRFPEVASLLTMMGAKILVYPSSHSFQVQPMRWHVMAIARAIEQQCFVISSTQKSTTAEFIDNSVIINPSGSIIAKCRPNDMIAAAYIDLSLVNAVRNVMPRLDHRRWDCYSITTVFKHPKNIKFDPTRSATHYSFLTNDGLFRFGHVYVPMTTIFCYSAYAVAFTNIRCVVPGHVLVATKRQVARLKDMHIDEAQDFFQLVGRVQRLVEYVQRASSMTITIQDGNDAGQTINHVHCHVMPRRRNDFEHNDLIYEALERHDAPGPAGDAGYDSRTISEMSFEAYKYIEYADFF